MAAANQCASPGVNQPSDKDHPAHKPPETQTPDARSGYRSSQIMLKRISERQELAGPCNSWLRREQHPQITTESGLQGCHAREADGEI